MKTVAVSRFGVIVPLYDRIYISAVDIGNSMVNASAILGPEGGMHDIDQWLVVRLVDFGS